MPKLPKAIPIKRAQYPKKKDYGKAKISLHDTFYKSPEWRRLRDWYIRHNPLCEWCEEEGKTKAADVVDHIKEILDGGELLDEKNLRSMCHKHHNQKTNWERSKRKKI